MSPPVAIITAASEGIGAACARELAGRGYAVSLLARGPKVLELARELRGLGTQGSVSSNADLEALVTSTRDRFGRVDAVVCNTGHVAKGELLELTDAQWHEGLDLVLLSVIRLTRLVTPLMEARGGGAWVNISSFTAEDPSLPRPVSSAFRAALSSYTRMYAERYARAKIRMNSVLPGWVETHPVPEAEARRIGLGRAADPAEVAKVVAFLLGPEASYVTGENVRVDGLLLRSPT